MEHKTVSHMPVLFQPKDKNALLDHMNNAQREIFDDLKTLSPDCTREEWFSIGLNIWYVFGDDLGGDVFRFWSEPGHSYVPQGCAVTWENIIRPLAKLSKAVKVADASNQGKTEGKALSSVTVTFREDTKPFEKTDGVFNKDTFS